MGFGRACAPVRCAHPSFWAHWHAKQALRAPPPSFAAPQKKIKLQYFQKQNASLQAQTRAARGVYFSTGLSCSLLSYIAPYWVTLHPIELRCTLLSYAASTELRRTLYELRCILRATLHPSELCCTLSEQHCASLHPKSYAAPSW